MYSEHDNGAEDRRWQFMRSQLPGGFSLSGCTWSSFTSMDSVFSLESPTGNVVAGARSYHDNGREDRSYGIYWCLLNGGMEIERQWTNQMNAHDGSWIYTSPTNRFITGMWSDHSNSAEPSCSLAYFSFTGWTGFTNEIDGGQSYECGSNQVLAARDSHHSNGAEDRQWRFRCGSLGNGAYLNECYWTDYTSWRSNFKLHQQDPEEVVIGMRSYHDNGKEDRRYAFKYCRLQNAYQVSGSDWYSPINDCDGIVNFNLPTTHLPIGMYSWHSDSARDRQFRVQAQKFCITNPQLLPTPFPTPGPCSSKAAFNATVAAADWANEAKENVHFVCPENSVLSSVQSSWSSGDADRRWKFGCKGILSGATLSNCKWSQITSPASTSWFLGTDSTVITGVASQYRSSSADREYSPSTSAQWVVHL
eukprot:TRINITY_DN2966_c1_g2_i4.p1 TRINITY_DN2966_c1_g2~~TRINITY_DN2966_c1_g2_i4.p1  ORF type:complete len:419 (-),score=46.40 TRINITY_DN2966_c1_g2_i4:469-1725(-)